MLVQEKRFIVDCMLGKLAKWLRILGYDTTYYPVISDPELIRVAEYEARTLLTRDIRLTQRRSVTDYLVIISGIYPQQLRQVVRYYHLDPFSRLFTRCLQCNYPLQSIAKEQVRALVPQYVFQTQEHFQYCPACQQIYWAGTHRTEMLNHLSLMLSEDEDKI
jgi:hypothetical protein